MDLPAPLRERLAQTLVPEELRRAERYHFPRDRDRFVCGRGLLRLILGRYCHCLPERLTFTTTPYGKPLLAEGTASPLLHFNVSHSEAILLVAVSPEYEIGVDVERIRTDLDYVALMPHCFAPAERAALALLPADLQREAFFACWTRKEAYIKATGLGMSQDLQSFVVSVDPQRPAALLAGEGSGPASPWTVQDLPTEAGYRAALVLKGPCKTVRFGRLPTTLL